MRGKKPKEGSNRFELREKFGFDVKFGYHVVRLMDEVEQILSTGTVDLQRAKEHMKAVRRGEVTFDDIVSHFNEREKTLENLYSNSKLPYKPDEDKIKELLMNCLEQHYGSIDNCVVRNDKYEAAIRKIERIVNEI